MRSRKLSLIALLTALSIVAASMKIPSHIGSIALDAFPALVAAVLIGGGAGAVVASIGHLVSALLGGMPLGPFHLLIATEMALLAWVFDQLYSMKNKYFAGLVFVIGNTIVAPLPFMFLMSNAFYVAVLPSLLIGSIINTSIALLCIPRLQSTALFKNTKQGIGP